MYICDPYDYWTGSQQVGSPVPWLGCGTPYTAVGISWFLLGQMCSYVSVGKARKSAFINHGTSFSVDSLFPSFGANTFLQEKCKTSSIFRDCVETCFLWRGLGRNFFPLHGKGKSTDDTKTCL